MIKKKQKFFVKNINLVSKFFYDFDEYRKRNKLFILSLLIISTIILGWFLVSKTDQTSTGHSIVAP